MDREKIAELEMYAREIRVLTLEMMSTIGVGHVGGCMSIADVLAVLYFGKMRIDPKRPDWQERDRLVLSKGHAGPALYAALALKGYFPLEQCMTLNEPGTYLPSHCDCRRTVGVDMTAGSLGQGFSAAVGIAIAQKIDKTGARTYSIIGDGESQEGQIWEAAMLAGSRKLNNLIGFTDYNGMQIDGTVDEVNTIEPILDKWRSFNWNVYSVDGHDMEAISGAIDRAHEPGSKPTMIILNTIKGKGASFCEGKVTSHNMPVTHEDFEQAVREIKGGK